MNTLIFEIEEAAPDAEKLQSCAALLRKGGTVVFPTETVYGLGANGLSPEAIEKIYIAKGRPSDNPLILHVYGIEDIHPLVREIHPWGELLMEAFWPGPLTLILKKSELVPLEATGGLDTVAVRMPSHPVARELIKLTGLPIVAPSANLSGKPSPTQGAHVLKDLYGRVDGILLAGNSQVGIESTVVDLTVDPPMILRPGGVTLEMLQQVVPQVVADLGLRCKDLRPKSPGMKYTHYAPRAEVTLFKGPQEAVVQAINHLAAQYTAQGLPVGIICTDETKEAYPQGIVKSMGRAAVMEEIAANLFKVLREFDETDVAVILGETVSEAGLGTAIMNRLEKAAGYRIVSI